MDRPWHKFRAWDGKLSVDHNRLLIVVTHNIVLVGFKHKVVSSETPCVVAEVTHIHSHCPRTQKLVCLLRRYKCQMVLVHITGYAVCLHVDPRVAVVVTRCDRPYMAFELAFNSNLVIGQNLPSARARNLLDAMVVDRGVVFDSLIKLAASFTGAWWCWSSVMLIPGMSLSGWKVMLLLTRLEWVGVLATPAHPSSALIAQRVTSPTHPQQLVCSPLLGVDTMRPAF